MMFRSGVIVRIADYHGFRDNTDLKICKIYVIKYSILLYNVSGYRQIPSSLVKSVPTLCKMASTVCVGKGHINAAFLARQSMLLT